jgi:8-oxo-dGTP pyrophosphatase MutT (NUDIX family)
MGYELQIDDIKNKLSESFQAGQLPEHDFPLDLIKYPHKNAAVLIPFFRIRSEWNILFIRRSIDLTEHSGQVAFPGGRVECDEEDPIQTALREAWEETGLHASDVKILGKMNNYLTITNFSVTPIVCVIPWPYIFRPEKKEVSKIFHIPLKWLADPLNKEERLRKLPDPHEPIRVIYFRVYNGEIVWGFTARILISLLDILL